MDGYLQSTYPSFVSVNTSYNPHKIFAFCVHRFFLEPAQLTHVDVASVACMLAWWCMLHDQRQRTMNITILLSHFRIHREKRRQRGGNAHNEWREECWLCWLFFWAEKRGKGERAALCFIYRCAKRARAEHNLQHYIRRLVYYVDACACCL